MRKSIPLLYRAIASSFLLTVSSCQFLPSKYPKVTTVVSIPVPVSTFAIQPATSMTTVLALEGTATSTTTRVGTESSTATDLNATPESVTSVTATEAKNPSETSTTVAVEPSPSPAIADVETASPTPTVPADNERSDPTQMLVETVTPTTTEVEQTLTELKAEKTIEGIKFNLPENILFDFDKYYVRAAAKPTLEKVNQVLTHFKDAQVFIYGHTDGKGEADYNMELSKKRSAAVKYYFVNNFQIEPTRLQTQGFGESQPIAPNENADGSDNPAGREKNRRVEFIIKTETRKVVISQNSDPFGEAVKAAMSAATLTQNAKTPEQWQQVANKWQEAIALMEAVPESSANYNTARQKAIEYQNNLNYAQQNAG